MTHGDIAFDDARRYSALMRTETDPKRRAELIEKQAAAFKAYADGLQSR